MKYNYKSNNYLSCDSDVIKQLFETASKYFVDNKIDGHCKFEVKLGYLQINMIIGYSEYHQGNVYFRDIINLNKIMNAENVKISIIKDVNDGKRIYLEFFPLIKKE